MRLFFFLFCSIIFSFSAAAEDALGIYENTACRGTKSSLTENDIQVLFEKGLFPGPAHELGPFVNRVENWKKWQTQLDHSCTRLDPTYLNLKVPHQAQMALADLTRETTKKISSFVRGQQAIVEMASTCSEKLVEITARGKRISEVGSTDFAFMKNPALEKQCMALVKSVVPMLGQRLANMRKLLGVMQAQKEGGAIQHDKPFSNDLVSIFFPTVWKKNTSQKLSPLDAGEAAEASKLEISSQEARDLYYQTLSTTPVLLYFDKEITPESLAKAFSEMKKQNHFDLARFEKSPPQEMIYLVPFVLDALEEMPIEKRGDACFIIHALHQNMIKQYQTMPQLIARLGLVISIAGGLGGKTVAEGLSIASRYAGYATSAYGASRVRNSLTKYSQGVALCSAVAMESGKDTKMSELKGLCDFQGMDETYRQGQSQAVIGALSGVLLSGVSRVLRPAAPR